MRIPAEAMSLYLTEMQTMTDADSQRPEPVNNASILGDVMEHNAPDYAAIAREAMNGQTPAQPPRKIRPERRHSAHARHAYFGDDRRKAERRTQNLPVMLDTRTTPSRRKEVLAARIDFSI